MKDLKKRCAFLSSLLLPGILVFSCAQPFRHYSQIQNYLVQADYPSALRLIRENSKAYTGPDSALYYLDGGILAHYAGNYQESNRFLARAESIMNELYTRSLSRETASFLINDRTIPYRGEDFENALVNLFMALNYAELGLWEDALVEARKVDSKLSAINGQYGVERRSAYKEDAFIRFLMGVLYEAGGEKNDAFISYRKAEEIYRTDYLVNYGIPAPPVLIENLLRTARALDFHEEAAKIQEQYDCTDTGIQGEEDKTAEVYFVHYNGQGPEKVEQHWFVPMSDGYVIKIAYPRFERRPRTISRAEIDLINPASESSFRFPTVLVEDIGAIAVKNLENRIAGIRAKAIARATAKYLATMAAVRSAEKRDNESLALLVQVVGNMAGIITEHADLRHWRLLPAEIRIGRARVPPGQYRGEIGFVDAEGHVVFSRAVESFTIKEGEKRFFTCASLL
ncbi:MAG: hypothetical protein JRJ26_16730 [Deltaproteobacteria bacterium]|nr:hypothetical protein [Deltaproteobacteria bacterium]